MNAFPFINMHYLQNVTNQTRETIPYIPPLHDSPSKGIVQKFANGSCFYAKQKGLYETCHSRAVGTRWKADAH